MTIERTSIYCQNCRAQNSLKDSHCQMCGTRLLLVVFPASLQFDSNHVPSFYEDHLLERISLLELRVIQLTDGLRAAADVLRDQTKMIAETVREVSRLDRVQRNGAPEEPTVSVSPTAAIARMVAGHDLPNVDLFAKLLGETVRLFNEKEEKEGFRMLERAVLLSPRNSALLSYAATAYFRADLFNDARRHLEKCVLITPDDRVVLLLLGALAADDGDLEQARKCLSLLVADEDLTGIVNLVWGLMAAAEGDSWAESAAALKMAVEATEAPELHYLLGCVCFELGDYHPALKSFQRAIAADRTFSDAWFMQAAVYQRLGDSERCGNMLENADQTKGSGSQCVEFLRQTPQFPERSLPFVRISDRRAAVLTGGSVRIARFVKTELIRTIERGERIA